jgi:hypothetical protein
MTKIRGDKGVTEKERRKRVDKKKEDKKGWQTRGDKKRGDKGVTKGVPKG